MGAELPFPEPEDPVSDREGRDAPADRFHHARKLRAQDRDPGPGQPGEDPDDEGLGGPEAAVRPVHGCEADLDEHLVVPGDRLGDVRDANHVRRAVPGVNGGPHALIGTNAPLPSSA